MEQHMNFGRSWAMVGLVVGLMAGCSEAGSKPEQSEPETPAAVLAAVERDQVAGKPESALGHAQRLISQYAGSPEADSAQKLLLALQAAAEAAAKAERERAEKEAAEAEARALADKWTYSSDIDEMTSKKSRTGMIESENSVEFDFPYQGPQHATLVLRDHPSYGRDVLLMIQRGQILCQSYETCTIRIRFDDGEPSSWEAIGPGDNSSTSIFIQGAERFRQRMRKAKIVRIQIPVYQEGRPTFEFQVGGFDANRFAEGQ